MLSAAGRLVYRSLLGTYRRPLPRATGIRRGFLEWARASLVRLGDPVIALPLGDGAIHLHLSHNLPLYKAAFPLYDTGFARLCGFARATDRRLDVIDVGANIGDTVLQVPASLGGTFLCIEGDTRYLPLLQRNTAGRSGITRVHAICDEVEGPAGGEMVHSAGTSRVHAAEGSRGARHTTLDAIVRGQEGFSPNVLKIDTDGYDYRVLRGGRETLERHRPLLFLEISPPHLELAGERAESLFPFLVSAGYGRVAVYDNLGHFVTVLEATDAAGFGELLERARRRAEYYYDVIAFPRERAGDQATFAEAEAAFFARADAEHQ